MAKKTERDYSEWLTRVIAKWEPRLNLQYFDIRHEKDPKQSYLACRYNYPYLNGTILWTDESFKSWAKGDPIHEDKIVHELCHLITDPFYTKAIERYITKDTLEDERERLTDQICTILVKNFRAKK
jgi:hypothetical protein